MYDYTNIVQGGVYEVIGRNGNVLDKLYMIVSDDIYNAMSAFVLVCPIDDPTDTYQGIRYHVPFDLIVNKVPTQMHICAERIFNLSKSKLGKYKFTLSREIQREVTKKVIVTITGERMYSLSEAIVELHNIEVDKKIRAVTSVRMDEPEYIHEKDSISIQMELDEFEEDNLSCEDSQKMFAMRMKGTPIDVVVSEDTGESAKEDLVEETPEPLEIDEPKKQPKKKKKRGGARSKNGGKPDPKYEHVYAHKEDFLLDYYSLDKDECIKKWNLDDAKSLSNRAYACRQMLKREGFDISYFDQLAKERLSESKKRTGKIVKMPAV